MHELQITERILNIVLQHTAGQEISQVVRIHLRVGQLSDLEDEWIQHYFEYLSRGTVAERARLVITRAPIVVRCDACGGSFERTRAELGQTDCPACAEPGLELVSGRGYFVENMEVV